MVTMNLCVFTVEYESVFFWGGGGGVQLRELCISTVKFYFVDNFSSSHLNSFLLYNIASIQTTLKCIELQKCFEKMTQEINGKW